MGSVVFKASRSHLARDELETVEINQPLAAASLYASIALTRILAWSTIGITYPSSLIFFSESVADGLWTPV